MMTNRTNRSDKPNSELFDAAQRRFGNAEYRPIESLTAYSPTPRRQPERQLAKLTASIKRFGFAMPALADGNGAIIAGHARIEAARRGGLTEVPVLVACGWTEAQIGSYRHAYSRLTELATWDEQLLTIELSGLLGVDGLLNSLGCEPSEIDLILSEAAIGDGDKQPANAASKLPPVVVSRLRRSWSFEVYRLPYLPASADRRSSTSRPTAISSSFAWTWPSDIGRRSSARSRHSRRPRRGNEVAACRAREAAVSDRAAENDKQR